MDSTKETQLNQLLANDLFNEMVETLADQASSLEKVILGTSPGLLDALTREQDIGEARGLRRLSEILDTYKEEAKITQPEESNDRS